MSRLSRYQCRQASREGTGYAARAHKACREAGCRRYTALARLPAHRRRYAEFFCRQQKILFPIVPWRPPLARLDGSGENRCNLAVIIAAPAEIAGQRAAGLRLSRRGIFHEQRLARHDLTGSAEATLRPVMLDEGFLY